ncbi:MAG: hypothetical protein QOK38_4034 [Acidobacteriaceae bacterium]|jgi:hypothetical protein|nr:hypothetical protein [Acidobacteriaceae bacterium]
MPRPSSRKQKSVRLICWNEADASARAAGLRHAGYRVIADPPENPGGMVRYFRELAPDAVVIDLDRLPSHGRELGLSLRASKSTSHLRLVFAGGVPAKIELVRAAIPDAIFTPWDDGVDAAIERAIAQPDPPRLPSRELPKDTSPGSLERKLDIKPQAHFVIVLVNRNDNGWLAELLSLPEGAVQQRRIDAATTLALFPVATRRDLMCALEQARSSLPPKASLWIVHPKQTSRLAADFNQDDVREAGLAHGFVDYKVCAVDKDWSALKFARRGVTKVKPHIMRR